MSTNKLPNIVADDEFLARYIVYGNHIRADNTVKPDAFVPSPHAQLSVTRHLGLTDNDIWMIGTKVAKHRERELTGHVDVACLHYRKEQLCVRSSPLPNNPNHADVIGWPVEKAQQKLIALEIAKAGIYRARTSAAL